MICRKQQIRSRSQADNVMTAVFNDRAEPAPTIKDPYLRHVVFFTFGFGGSLPYCFCVSSFSHLSTSEFSMRSKGNRWSI